MTDYSGYYFKNITVTVTLKAAQEILKLLLPNYVSLTRFTASIEWKLFRFVKIRVKNPEILLIDVPF